MSQNRPTPPSARPNAPSPSPLRENDRQHLNKSPSTARASTPRAENKKLLVPPPSKAPAGTALKRATSAPKIAHHQAPSQRFRVGGQHGVQYVHQQQPFSPPPKVSSPKASSVFFDMRQRQKSPKDEGASNRRSPSKTEEVTRTQQPRKKNRTLVQDRNNDHEGGFQQRRQKVRDEADDTGGYHSFTDQKYEAARRAAVSNTKVIVMEEDDPEVAIEEEKLELSKARSRLTSQKINSSAAPSVFTPEYLHSHHYVLLSEEKEWREKDDEGKDLNRSMQTEHRQLIRKQEMERAREAIKNKNMKQQSEKEQEEKSRMINDERGDRRVNSKARQYERAESSSSLRNDPHDTDFFYHQHPDQLTEVVKKARIRHEALRIQRELLWQDQQDRLKLQKDLSTTSRHASSSFSKIKKEEEEEKAEKIQKAQREFLFYEKEQTPRYQRSSSENGKRFRPPSFFSPPLQREQSVDNLEEEEEEVQEDEEDNGPSADYYSQSNTCSEDDERSIPTFKQRRHGPSLKEAKEKSSPSRFHQQLHVVGKGDDSEYSYVFPYVSAQESNVIFQQAEPSADGYVSLPQTMKVLGQYNVSPVPKEKKGNQDSVDPQDGSATPLIPKSKRHNSQQGCSPIPATVVRQAFKETIKEAYGTPKHPQTTSELVSRSPYVISTRPVNAPPPTSLAFPPGWGTQEPTDINRKSFHQLLNKVVDSVRQRMLTSEMRRQQVNGEDEQEEDYGEAGHLSHQKRMNTVQPLGARGEKLLLSRQNDILQRQVQALEGQLHQERETSEQRTKKTKNQVLKLLESTEPSRTSVSQELQTSLFQTQQENQLLHQRVEAMQSELHQQQVKRANSEKTTKKTKSQVLKLLELATRYPPAGAGNVQEGEEEEAGRGLANVEQQALAHLYNDISYYQPQWPSMSPARPQAIHTHPVHHHEPFAYHPVPLGNVPSSSFYQQPLPVNPNASLVIPTPDGLYIGHHDDGLNATKNKVGNGAMARGEEEIYYGSPLPQLQKPSSEGGGAKETLVMLGSNQGVHHQDVKSSSEMSHPLGEYSSRQQDDENHASIPAGHPFMMTPLERVAHENFLQATTTRVSLDHHANPAPALNTVQDRFQFEGQATHGNLITTANTGDATPKLLSVVKKDEDFSVTTRSPPIAQETKSAARLLVAQQQAGRSSINSQTEYRRLYQVGSFLKENNGLLKKLLSYYVRLDIQLNGTLHCEEIVSGLSDILCSKTGGKEGNTPSFPTNPPLTGHEVVKSMQQKISNKNNGIGERSTKDVLIPYAEFVSMLVDTAAVEENGGWV